MYSKSSYYHFCWSMKTLVLVVLFGGVVLQVEGLNFSYPSFPQASEKDFILTNHSEIAYNALQVTLDVSGAPIKNLSGRIFYGKQFKLWRRRNGSIATFNSTFVLNIVPQRDSPGPGEGLAFVLSGESSIPDHSEGQWLGIVNASTNGSSSSNIVAVEFDTRKSYPEDIDDNHVGLDVNSIYSRQQIPLSGYGVNLSSGTDITFNIQYNGTSLRVFLVMSNGTQLDTVNPLISYPIDLSEYLREKVYVGFSASTGNNTQLNCVKSWDFTGEDIEDDPLHLLWVWILIPVATLLLCGLTGFIYYYYLRRKHGEKKIVDPTIEIQIGGYTIAPRRFKFKELKTATANFHPNNKLGKGGFGTVYKGLILKENNLEIAVKRVSEGSTQGKQEFIAEVTTISRLRHKNLVKLIGWCYEGDELLLVYEFLSGGSLDKLIFPAQNQRTKDVQVQLSWKRRHKIICGVASALDYLHNGSEKRVLHRDVKSSNVMLDAEFNARLGDFGLARTVQQEGETHHSTQQLAGTPGYMAPECSLTGRATVESDVYGFGVFLLEVACGRRPGNQNPQSNSKNNIVDWVWELYGKGQILDAVDPRLQQDDLNEEQMECVLKLGLACCHPNPNYRPSMRMTLQVLTGETIPPTPPNKKPAFIWPAAAASFLDDLDFSLPIQQLTPSTYIS